MAEDRYLYGQLIGNPLVFDYIIKKTQKKHR